MRCSAAREGKIGEIHPAGRRLDPPTRAGGRSARRRQQQWGSNRVADRTAEASGRRRRERCGWRRWRPWTACRPKTPHRITPRWRSKGRIGSAGCARQSFWPCDMMSGSSSPCAHLQDKELALRYPPDS